MNGFEVNLREAGVLLKGPVHWEANLRYEDCGDVLITAIEG
jgi:hypothetical protein